MSYFLLNFQGLINFSHLCLSHVYCEQNYTTWFHTGCPWSLTSALVRKSVQKWKHVKIWHYWRMNFDIQCLKLKSRDSASSYFLDMYDWEILYRTKNIGHPVGMCALHCVFYRTFFPSPSVRLFLLNTDIKSNWRPFFISVLNSHL